MYVMTSPGVTCDVTLQESGEQQASSLAARIGEKEAELQQRQQEVSEQQEVQTRVRQELETLKRQHKDMIEELRTARDKVRSRSSRAMRHACCNLQCCL